jgi:hypothetical protein
MKALSVADGGVLSVLSALDNDLNQGGLGCIKNFGDNNISSDGNDNNTRDIEVDSRRFGKECNPTNSTITLEDDFSAAHGDESVSDDDANSLVSFSGFSDPGGRFAITNESVHYHHRSGFHLSDGYSCHGRVEQVKLNENVSKSVPDSVTTIVPPWVHVFAKSTQFSSLRTQVASIAYLEEPIHKKARHRRNRRSLKKEKKQHRLLTEVIVPPSIQEQLLSTSDIDNHIVVFDGGDAGNPPIRPPDGVTWHAISVLDGKHIYVQDEFDPKKGLTFAPVNGVRPFIRLPRQHSLNIVRRKGMNKIFSALEACSKLKKTSLVRSDRKRIFGDYGERVMATCAGVLVSRNSREVLDYAPFMENLPREHWRVLMSLMRCAEYAFEEIAEHQVISHIVHAKKVVPFKTMNMPGSTQSQLKYYGGLAFGCNLFLRCHTDADFTMSMAQVHLKHKDQYELDDDIVVFFCFPTLGVAVPLRPGDFLLFNAQIPHCVSSRCKHSDKIMVLSMYLKASVVGMNDNQLKLNSTQEILAKRYHSIMVHQLQSYDRQRKLSCQYGEFYKTL